MNPPVMEVVRQMIGADCMMYDANIRVPMPSGERNKKQGFQNHVDREDYSVVPFIGGKHYPMAMNVTWTLVDFTIENGATLMWPGSHLSCQIPEPENFPPGYVYAEAPAGSAVIWDAALWHASGINKSTSLAAQQLYGSQSGVPDYSEVKILSSEQVAALTVEGKRVLGFAIY